MKVNEDLSPILWSAITRTLVLILSPRIPATFSSIWSAGFLAGTVHRFLNLEQMKEDSFLLFNDSRIQYIRRNSLGLYIPCAGSQRVTQTPPMLLLLFQPLFTFTTCLGLDSKSLELVQDFSVSFIMILVDSYMAFLLFKIGTMVTSSSSSSTNSLVEEETWLEEKMDKRIYPPYAWVFGLSQGKSDTTHPIDPKDNSPTIIPTNHLPTMEAPRVDHPLAPFFSIQSLPTLSCKIFCYNPIIFFTSYFSIHTSSSSSHGGSSNVSFQSIPYLLVLSAMHTAMNQGSRVWMIALCMAMVTCIQGSFVIYWIPLILFYIQRRGNGNKSLTSSFQVWVPMLFYFISFYLGLSFLLTVIYGSSRSSFDSSNNHNNNTPNIGLLWYYNIQIFPPFRSFYQNLYMGVPFICVLPLFLRLNPYPLELFTAIHSTYTLLQSDPTLIDYVLSCSLMILSPRSVIRMSRISLIALAALPVPILLYIVTYGLWVESGTGNPNYIYFQCLALNLLFSVIALDFIGATVKRDKALRVTRKMISKLKI